MRLIDEATGIIYRTLEQGEVLTYRGSFKDCFEAQHSLVKTGEKCEGWQFDSPLETLQKAIPPQGVLSRVALKLMEEEELQPVKEYLPNSFRDILDKHVADLKNSRYAGIECLIANFILSTGLKIEAIELVETTKENEISWSVRRKS